MEMSNLIVSVETCPKCGKFLGQRDYQEEFDWDTGGSDGIFIKCSGCGYDEKEEQAERAFELMFA